MKASIKYLFRALGLEITRTKRNAIMHERADQTKASLPDQPEWINDIIKQVRPFTMTSPERIAALCQAISYIHRNRIPGDIVECGVWRGGSMMAACLSLMYLGDQWRDIYLFDTFAGMPPPISIDVESRTRTAGVDLLQSAGRSADVWAISSILEVKKNVTSIGYPVSRIHFIEGKVEDTIPGQAPNNIALLRLDTDWYESTAHELTKLYPRLVTGGILIIDDYGHWDGAKKAVDEFIESSGARLFLSRIDYTGRIAVKL